MDITTMVSQIRSGEQIWCLVRDDDERERAYHAILRRLDAENPLQVSSHWAKEIVLLNGGKVELATFVELSQTMEPHLRVCAIPAGEFWMGNEQGYGDERPLRRLTSAAFWMMRVPVTVGFYQLAVRAGAIKAPEDLWRLEWEEQLRSPFRPVVGVHIAEAETFAAWLSQVTGQPWRLPTEAEWEYAARGGTDQRLYPWGSDYEPWRVYVADRSPDDEAPHAATMVGTHAGGDSPFGVQDLVGNVAEWTITPWRLYADPIPTRTPEEQTMVIRGGGFAADLRTLTYRNWMESTAKRSDLGFRLVRSW